MGEIFLWFNWLWKFFFELVATVMIKNPLIKCKTVLVMLGENCAVF